MKTMKGPGIFLAQFVGPDAPFNSLPAIAKWAHDKGFFFDETPTTEKSLFDLRKAAESDAYCDEVKGILKDAGIVITELSTHLQGQLVAVHPAYDTLFDAFAPERVRNVTDNVVLTIDFDQVSALLSAEGPDRVEKKK